MDVQFTKRGEGWRTRGRPRHEVPEEMLALLTKTYEYNIQATIPIGNSDPSEVRYVVALLKRGAAQLGLRLREQHDTAVIRFYAEDKPA